MECKSVKRSIGRWVDGELDGVLKASLEEHLRGCFSCQKEAKAFQGVSQILRQTVDSVEPSRNFDVVFWNKVSERQRTPWFTRLLKDLEVLMPVPNLRQAVVFALLAFFIGNLGGITAQMNKGAAFDVSAASVHSLSGFKEFKGIPSNSIASTYLRIIEKEVSE